MNPLQILDLTTTVVRIKLAEAKSTVDSAVVFNYSVMTASDPHTPHTQIVLTNATTAVKVIIQPGSGEVWQVANLTVTNFDDISHTYTVDAYDGTNAVNLTDPFTLTAGKSKTLPVEATGGGGAGILELTGDVTAGPGTGTVAATVITVGGAVAADVADAVTKRHTQNTDTGTTQSTWQIDSGSSGPKLKNSAGELQVRNAADSLFANFQVAQIIQSAWKLLIGGFNAIFTHANSADRTYTLPNASGTVALTSDIPAAVTSLTGDVTGTGPGATATTVNTVGGASAANVADAVTKRHTQNTDTGTTQTTWQIDSGGTGPKLKNSSGEMQVRNAADAAFANFQVAQIIQSAWKLLIGGFNAIFTHANTADRTYTLPDQTGTVALVGNLKYQTLAVDDVDKTQRSKLDLKAGSNVTLTFSDNGGADRSEVTIASTASGGGGGGDYDGCDLRMSLSSSDPFDYNTAAGTHLYIHPIQTGNVDVLVSGVKTTINVPSYIDLNLASVAATGSKPYDIFVYESGGSIAAEALVWTNDTTRATAIIQNSTLGYWVKSGATTRRYIGTIYTDSGGGACTAKVNILHLQNAKNRKNIQVDCFTGATRASTGYTTASNSYVAVNDTTIGSSRLSWVQGLSEPDLIVGWDIKSFSAVYSPYYNYAGISIDGAAPVNDTYGSNSGAIITYLPMQIPLMCPSTAGRHYADKQFHTSSSTATITDNGFLGRYAA